jgi:DNA-binding MarR family transcriptional regulator
MPDVSQPLKRTVMPARGARSQVNLADELRIAIMRTSRRLRTEGSGNAVTPGQYSVLSALKEGVSSVGELATREQVRPPSMTRTVAALVEMGLVDRRTSTDDRRHVVVALTTNGRKVLRDTHARRSEWLARQLTDLNDEEREVLTRAAELLRAISAR